jgi:hypothetical protein
VAIRDRVLRHYVISFLTKLVGLGSSGSNVRSIDWLYSRNTRQLGKTYLEIGKPYGSNQHMRLDDETPTEPLRADGDRCKKEK